MQPHGSKVPLFCVHGVGGNVLVFSDLVRRMGVDQPCFGLQAKGVDGKTPPSSCLREIAAFYLEEIQDVQPDGPYLLCGYSSGGVIAFEMAKQLRQSGKTVALLALFDTYYPNFYERTRRVSWLKYKLKREGLLSYVKSSGRAIWRTQEERIKNQLIKVFKRFGMTIPPFLRPQHLALHFFEALKKYESGDYPGEIVLLRSDLREDGWGPDHGWGAHAGGGVEVIDVPGAHEDFLREPRAESTSEILKQLITARLY